MKFLNLLKSFICRIPSLSLDAFLYNSKCEIELMHDPSMLKLIETSILGGLSFTNRKFSNVVNHPNKHIVYTGNNLNHLKNKMFWHWTHEIYFTLHFEKSENCHQFPLLAKCENCCHFPLFQNDSWMESIRES